MKVLVISHTVFSVTSNMGKTLLAYFNDFTPGEIAQLYIHSEVPTNNKICVDYYRFTDQDAIKSIFFHKYCGNVFRKKDIQVQRKTSRTDTGKVGSLYQFGRKRTAGIHVARNLIWKLSHWKNKQLYSWLKDFDPDIIFFASGDYKFMYEITSEIVDYLKKPLVISCMDDYYNCNKNEDSWLGRQVHRSFMKSVRATMKRASAIFTICDSMTKDYAKMFGVQCFTLHTPTKEVELNFEKDANRISYIGNVGHERDDQLVEIGRALKKIEIKGAPKFIDVYSAEKRPEVLKKLTEENGIKFHGAISAEEVLKVMAGSIAVIHTESFNEKTKNTVKYSVSTKIAESLMYGPCLIAFGPSGIASIDYLKSEGAAFVITEPEKLQASLKKFLDNKLEREIILKRARDLALKNHRLNENGKKVRLWLEQIAEQKKV